MKVLTFLLAITLFPTISFANDLDNQINKACLRHAVSLVARLKTEVIGELSPEKSDQALKLATESCQAYFKKEFNQNTIATSESKNKEEGDKEKGKVDWFTEKILSGDTSRKKGNKRLRKIK